MFKKPIYTAPDFNQAKFHNSPNASTDKVKIKGIAPDNYHATSIYPEYYKVNGQWRLIPQTRMDCVPVINSDGSMEAKEFRRLQVGDTVIVGRVDDGTQGIYLYNGGFKMDADKKEPFAFRNGRSRETSFGPDYDRLVELLKHDKNQGHIIWVLGPAVIFNSQSREAMEYIIEHNYAHAIFGGNAVATHDLEGALFGTAVGQDIRTCENRHNGHYHHLDAINMINKAGSIAEAIKAYNIDNGVICSCVKNNIPYVLAGSIRDDGPLAGVLSDMSKAQDEMRYHIKKATTIVCLATQLHTIATGNLTPSYTVIDGEVRQVFIYAVDISEFVLNKLRDRGTLEVTTIVSNVQDFLFKLVYMLNKPECDI
jgi:lysine-ketoglutarate reductase/saccharopine dehydrogenase-like protein (TIGR00300 family)